MTYATVTALRLGLRPAVVTSAGPELGLAAAFEGADIHVIPAARSTTFLNAYEGGRRHQVVRDIAAPIAASDVPVQWRSAPLVLLTPLAGEVGYELATSFPGAMVMASIQGWLRRWDHRGRVSPAHWMGEEVLPHVDAAVVSVEYVGDSRLIERWREMVGVLIVTKGSEGASLHFDGGWHHIEPYTVPAIDPTGAGDVFAAAFLIEYGQGGYPLEAARFAGCAASFCIETQGLSGIPSRQRVEERLTSGPHGRRPQRLPRTE